MKIYVPTVFVKSKNLKCLFTTELDQPRPLGSAQISLNVYLVEEKTNLRYILWEL